MEIELTGLKPNKQVPIIAFLAVLALMLIGNSFTDLDPSTGAPQVMIFSEWQILKLERVYHQQLAVLRRMPLNSQFCWTRSQIPFGCRS